MKRTKTTIEARDLMQISRPSNIVLNIIFSVIVFLMILPLIFVVIISFTSQEAIDANGYSFFPSEWSFSAYKYVFGESGKSLLSAILVSVIVTGCGMLFGTSIMATYAYVISRRDFKYRKIFSVIALIPMLFSGGMVANYLIMVQFLGLKDSLLALILPLAVSPFFLFILRSFYQNFVPESLMESAKVDGANEFQTFFKIVIPISKPGIATIALFLTLGYWNDWFHAMLYIDTESKIPIQYMLIKMENTAQFLRDMAGQMGAGSMDFVATLPADTMKMAIVVIVVAPIAFAYPFFQRYFVQGLTVGAVKG